ncbi:hypothetical protein [Maribacter sp. LLG6340-A2]|uniref:hypothetical protein n=1 Tax=Maribacter sp. LLG6340-A2 TaxID=3160834 RepID=UPI00386B3B08
MKRVYLLAVLSVIVLFSCTDRDDNIDMVNIRIQNSTQFLFNEVRVAQRDTVYENIAPDEFSEYLGYDKAYKTSALTILTDSTSYNYFPDEVPSDTLPVGFYTYQINIDEADNVVLTFRIDE